MPSSRPALPTSSSSSAAHIMPTPTIPTIRSSSSLAAAKTQSKSKSLDEKNTTERQRNCLILIHAFLQQNGYIQTSTTLQNEAGRSMMSKYECADNVDLHVILCEYEDFYQLKYGRRPKLSRRVVGDVSTSTSTSTLQSTSISKYSSRMITKRNRSSTAKNRPSTAAVCGNSPSWGSSSTKTKRKNRRSLTGGTTMTLGGRPPSSSSSFSTSSTTGTKKLLPRLKSFGSGGDLAATATATTTTTALATTCLGSPLLQSSSVHVGENVNGTSSCYYSGNNTNDMNNVRGTRRNKEAGNDDDDTNDENNHHPLHVSNSQQTMDERVLKPLPIFQDTEIQNLATTIKGEILETSPNITWDDIVGLDNAKRLLKEAIILPLTYPTLFKGILSSSWRGALLFGEPGNGKTILAKAVATEANTTFFNMSASSLVSKYRGDSEKLIRVTFELARFYAPSTIFLDEIDAIMSQRGGSSGGGGSSSGGGGGVVMEHEGSRRMKTELLMEMDGVGKGDQHVFVLAASNLPWDLDPALLRRLEKRIMIPTPSKDARKAMLLKHLSQHKHNLTDEDLERCAGDSSTEGYSGADIKLLCKEAAMAPVRRIITSLPPPPPLLQSSTKNCPSTSNSNINHRIQRLLEKDPITMADLQASLRVTKPSTCSQRSKRYTEWSRDYGSG